MNRTLQTTLHGPRSCSGPWPRRSRPRIGTAATELAIVLPLLVLLAFGCTDLGRAIATYIIVSNAARVGAEYGATHGYTSTSYSSWQTQVLAAANGEMQGTGTSFDPTRFTVTVAAVPTTGNFYRTTVTASYRFDMLTTLPGLAQEFPVVHTVSIDRFR